MNQLSKSTSIGAMISRFVTPLQGFFVSEPATQAAGLGIGYFATVGAQKILLSCCSTTGDHHEPFPPHTAHFFARNLRPRRRGAFELRQRFKNIRQYGRCFAACRKARAWQS